MKKEIADKWVAALRSGEYKQGRGQLRKGKYFCCLGVLCNLHAESHLDIAAKQMRPSRYMGHGGVLPQAVMEWSGVDAANGRLPDGSLLDEHNDTGASFAKIATLIEKHWQTL